MGYIAAQEHARGISVEGSTYLFLRGRNSGELWGETSSSSVYEGGWYGFWLRGNRVLIGLGDGCE